MKDKEPNEGTSTNSALIPLEGNLKCVEQETFVQILKPKLDGTIVLHDSDIIPCSVNETETDIIECSVEETRDKLDFLKTPKSVLKKSHVTDVREDVSLKDVRGKNDVNAVSPSSFSYTLRRRIGIGNDAVVSVSSCKTRYSIRTPKVCKENEDQTHPILNKILSSVKLTPDVPFLSKSKLRNIEKWLRENDVETVVTPPFANLSVTPTTQKKCPVTPSNKRRRSTSVDSEVEKVLVAVYGTDWREKNVLKKCKTEPRKRSNNLPATKTEIKPHKKETMKKLQLDGIASHNVRRNILHSNKKSAKEYELCEESDLDQFGILGVKDLNQSDLSDSFVIAKNFTDNKKRKRKKSFDPETSSCGSWKQQSIKKKKGKSETPSHLGTKRTPKNTTDRKTRQQKNIEQSAAKTPKKTFLASLSVSTPSARCHPEAQEFKINFKTKKEELVSKLFKLYNTEIFGGMLPENMNFSWNVKLRGTAGYCYNKKITKSTGEVIRSSRIELSSKIIDRADRLRDTLIHELCHAASWVIDGVLDGHGAGWNKWAKKAMTRFPELPTIKRCHNYDIVSKYTYRCTGCGYSINRHSKSIDTDRKRCGYCYGVLELFVNRKRKGKQEVPEFDSTRTMRTPNNFALFVKENYHSVKNITANAKHAEIMKVLSQQYALVKNAKVLQAPGAVSNR